MSDAEASFGSSERGQRKNAVGEWIDELVILEAKALLNSSSMNIQEIADRLNFANQSFFGKYFKHYTGMSLKDTGKANHRTPERTRRSVSGVIQKIRGDVCQRCTFDNFRMCFEQVIAFAGGFQSARSLL